MLNILFCTNCQGEAIYQYLKTCEEFNNLFNVDYIENWILLKQHLGLLAYQPSISKSDLSKIKVPVLIIAGDKDVIREEHSVEIYQNIREAQLCILPGETHFVPASNPDVFNKIVEEFIVKPFSRPDSDFTKW